MRSDNTETSGQSNTLNDVSPSRKYRVCKYLQLSEDERDKVKQLTQILCKFAISIEAYHELTQIPGNESMSRSYIVEGCQGHLDAKWDVCKTPDSFPGAELSFQLLLGEQLIDHVSVH